MTLVWSAAPVASTLSANLPPATNNSDRSTPSCCIYISSNLRAITNSPSQTAPPLACAPSERRGHTECYGQLQNHGGSSREYQSQKYNDHRRPQDSYRGKFLTPFRKPTGYRLSDMRTHQRLLDDGATLLDSNIEEGNIVHVFPQMTGS